MMHTREPVHLTVDVIIENEHGEVLLMRRNTEPFKDTWVLPGGFVEAGETVEQAALREVKEEVGLDITLNRLLGVYSTPGRDPRGAFVSVAFSGSVVGGSFLPNEEATAIVWVRSTDPPRPMGFDHAAMLADHWNGR